MILSDAYIINMYVGFTALKKLGIKHTFRLHPPHTSMLGCFPIPNTLHPNRKRILVIIQSLTLCLDDLIDEYDKLADEYEVLFI